MYANNMASFSTSSVYVSQEEFNGFHAIDRELYTIMVHTLLRDPAEAMQIMALWLWLESKGFPNVVKSMLSLPHFLINELADEAVTCLKFIASSTAALSHDANGEIPMLQSLMEKEFSFQFFRDNRQNAGQEVSKILKEVCLRSMSDLMQKANQDLVPPALAMPAFHHHPAAAAAALSLPLGLVQNLQPPAAATSSTNNSNTENEVHQDDRTMFVTFSKGYHVYEWELKEFFTRNYGNCVESLHMQEVETNEQSLFARIVFRKASAIDAILNGVTKAKFTINGKHVWMRKFVPKRTGKSQVPPRHQQQQQQLPNLPNSLFD